MNEAQHVPRPTQVHNVDFDSAVSLYLLAALTVAAIPGAAIGALIASAVWRITKPDIVMRWLFAGLGAATLAGLRSSLAIAWPWRALLHQWIAFPAGGLTAPAVMSSIPTELLAGPALLLFIESGTRFWRRTIHGQEWSRYHAMVSRKKALERHWPGPAGHSPSVGLEPGALRLGISAEGGGPFDLGAKELAQHVFVPGAAGAGKTTTLVTISSGALDNGYGVVIIDCKGSGLGAAAKKLAARHDVRFTAVDPRLTTSIGYDPCSGDAAAVANKLIGAFSFTAEAEIYKQVAMEVVPVICRALEASGADVTLDAIYDSFNRGGLARLGRRPGADAFRNRLEDLEDSGGVGAAGYSGFQRRLGALMEGAFGDLFRKRPALDWHAVMRKPQMTYMSLPTTAAGEDVALFGRVIAQDLKQVCDDRMRAIEQGGDIAPVLIIFDEFAALREPTQVVDLLLQARQARAPLVVATQFLPEEIPILRPLMSAGTLIVHRVEAEDAERMAAEFGTHTSPMLTAQVDYESGTSEKGSVRFVEEFNIHPNDIKELPDRVAAVYARQSMRRQIVRIKKLGT